MYAIRSYYEKNMIHALIYDPKQRKWSRKWRSFPHMIYDRCRIQRSIRFEQLKRFRARYRNMTFLNRPLRDKWTVYQTLLRKSRFRTYLPRITSYNVCYMKLLRLQPVEQAPFIEEVRVEQLDRVVFDTLVDDTSYLRLILVFT